MTSGEHPPALQARLALEALQKWRSAAAAAQALLRIAVEVRLAVARSQAERLLRVWHAPVRARQHWRNAACSRALHGWADAVNWRQSRRALTRRCQQILLYRELARCFLAWHKYAKVGFSCHPSLWSVAADHLIACHVCLQAFNACFHGFYPPGVPEDRLPFLCICACMHSVSTRCCAALGLSYLTMLVVVTARRALLGGSWPSSASSEPSTTLCSSALKSRGATAGTCAPRCSGPGCCRAAQSRS